MPVAPQTAAAIVEGLARLGLDPTRLGVPRPTDDETLALLWSRVIACKRRRTVPVEVGLALPLGAMGAVDYLAASSLTVGAALTMTQQTFPLVGPGVQLVIEKLRGGARRVAIVNHPPFPGQTESDGFILGILIGRLRLFASGPVGMPLVELTEPEPAAREPWQALLGVPRLRFGARRAALHLSADGWSMPLRSADPRLLSMLRAAVGVDEHSGDALQSALRTLATERLPQLLELESAAPALGLSRRTLQRKLAASGTSLSALVDEVRRDRAHELVSSGLLTLGEVAGRLGFAEQASFTRAWRRWFGAPPTEWRRSGRQSPAANTPRRSPDQARKPRRRGWAGHEG